MMYRPHDQFPPNGAPPGTVPRARTGALAVYERHGDALFSLALLLCRDSDRAADAVVTAVAQPYATAADAAPHEERRRLAADLWCRCADEPAAPEPMTEAGGPRAKGSSAEQEDALLGLVLFGGHTYAQAAALIGVPAPVAAMDLRSLLRRATGLPAADRPAGSS